MKSVYTLADLHSRNVLDQGASCPARLAVIGFPVTHSFSPQLHQPALDLEGRNIRYIRLEVQPNQVREAFMRMEDLEFIGTNVTIPHKLDALEACKEVDPAASAMGAVNTVKFTDKGPIGYNTDGPGLEQAILEETGSSTKDLRVLIVGAGGGAGRAISTHLAHQGCRQLLLANRSLEKIEPLQQKLTTETSTPISLTPYEENALIEALSNTDLIINTTSLGLKASDPCPLPPVGISSQHFVYDTIYNPAKTLLLQEAEKNGAQIGNGLSLLLHQGVLAYQHWFADGDPLSAMRKALSISR